MKPWIVDQFILNTAKHALEHESNAYLVTTSENHALMIDSGYDDSIEPILKRLQDRRVTLQGIYLTHYHPDHSLGAPILAREAKCPIYCHPFEYEHLVLLYKQTSIETTHIKIIPELEDQQQIRLDTLALDVIHTPGHTHGHIALFEPITGSLFTGDTVIPSGTVWIGPPDGHLSDYLHSLDHLMELSAQLVYPGHGATTKNPDTFMQQMKERRLLRERQIIELLKISPRTSSQLTIQLYAGVIAHEMQWVATKTIQGHLSKLREEKQIAITYDPIDNCLLYHVPEQQDCNN